jgi:O-antigen polymerase
MSSTLYIKPCCLGNRLSIALLCCLFAGLPSFYLKDFIDPTYTSKFVFFACVLLLILAAEMCKILFNSVQNWNVRISTSDLLLVLLYLYILLNRYMLQPEAGFSRRFCEFCGLGILYIILRRMSIVKSVLIMTGILIGGFIQIIHGILQLSGYATPRAAFLLSGNFANSGSYAGYLAIAGIVSLGTYLFADDIAAFIQSAEVSVWKPFNTYFALLLRSVSMINLLATTVLLPALRSRAAWIAFGIGCLYLLSRKYKWHNLTLKVLQSVKSRIAVGIITVIGLMTGFASLYFYKVDSADGRLLIYKVTVGVIKDHPWLGIGFDRFRAVYMDAQANWIANNPNLSSHDLADNTIYAFNEPLQFTLENGLTGVVLGLSAIYLISKFEPVEELRALAQIGVATLLSLFFFGMFTYYSENLPLLTIGVFATVLITNINDLHPVSNQLFTYFNLRLSHPMLVITTLFTTVVLAGGIRFAWQMKDSYTYWGKAIKAYNQQNFQSSFDYFQHAYNPLHQDGDFLMQYGKLLAMKGNASAAVEILTRAKHHLNNSVIEVALGDSYKSLGKFGSAEGAYKRASYMVPNRLYPKYLLAKLYDTIGNKAKANATAEAVLRQKVKVPSTAIAEMRDEMQRLLYRNNTSSLNDKDSN